MTQTIRELAGGVEMPVLGLGVWQISEGREAEQAVEWALEAGYRHVDTAAIYRNERSVGAALRAERRPARRGVRDDEAPAHASQRCAASSTAASSVSASTTSTST